jgi:hypothetical protein
MTDQGISLEVLKFPLSVDYTLQDNLWAHRLLVSLVGDDRAEQSKPVAITAFDGDFLKDVGVSL